VSKPISQSHPTAALQHDITTLTTPPASPPALPPALPPACITSGTTSGITSSGIISGIASGITSDIYIIPGIIPGITPGITSGIISGTTSGITGIRALTSLDISDNDLYAQGAKIVADAIKESVRLQSFWHDSYAFLTCRCCLLIPTG
jgi:hypothetical protein